MAQYKGSGGAPSDSQFVTLTNATELTGERALAVDSTLTLTDAGADASVTLKRAALTGDVTAASGSNTTVIAAAAVTLAKMADIATAKLIGRSTSGTGVPEALGVTSPLTITGGNLATTGVTALTTKGDIMTYGSSAARLGVGSDGQILTADAASTNGVKWGAAAAAASDADATTKGVVKLANDFSGTAALPTVVGLQGVALPAAAASKLIRKNSANNAWEAITYTGSNLDTDLSGKATASGAADQRIPYWNGTTNLTTAAGLAFDGTKLIASGTSQGVVTAGSTTGSNSVQVRGGATNTAELFVAGGTDHFVTGTVSGDIGLALYTNTKKIHLSAGGGTQVIIDGGSGTPTFSLGSLDLIKIKGCSLSWPSANASGLLTNNGSGTLSWATPKLDALTAPDDNTTLNASTSAHGLLKKLSNVSTEFMNGVGSWATPAASTDITGMTQATDYKVLTDSVPVYDASAAANRKFTGIDLISGRNRAVFEDDFWTSAAGAWWTVSGTVSNLASGSIVAGHPGVVSVAPSGATGTGGIILTSSRNILFGGGKWRIVMIVKTPAALSDGTNTYAMYLGFNDSGGTDATDGAYFRYTHSVNSGKWELVTRSSSSETATDTTITVVAATWYALEIEVNAAGSSVQAYINGSAAGAAAVANIPTASSRETSVALNINESAGTAQTAASSLQVDYVGVFFEPTTAR